MSTLSAIRKWILAVLLLGLFGTITELLLLEHYEEGWQLSPLVLIGCALGVLAWHCVQPSAPSVRALQGVMGGFVIVGVLGVILHFRGAAEFQLEIDSSQHGWDLFAKVIRAKAPPVLAPGSMVQLGLIGLTYAYRHPALTGPDRLDNKRSDLK